MYHSGKINRQEAFLSSQICRQRQAKAGRQLLSPTWLGILSRSSGRQTGQWGFNAHRFIFLTMKAWINYMALGRAPGFISVAFNELLFNLKNTFTSLFPSSLERRLARSEHFYLRGRLILMVLKFFHFFSSLWKCISPHCPGTGIRLEFHFTRYGISQ